MIVEAVKIRKQVKEKIETKHSITIGEIEKVLLEDKPKFRKVRDCYMAIGIFDRYLTIFFTYNWKTKEAELITAYPSSRWQIKLYKRSK